VDLVADVRDGRPGRHRDEHRHEHRKGNDVIRKMGIEWHLRLRMAERGMFATTDLVPLLAERGIHLSREQVYRLVTNTPQRLSTDVLAALCDMAPRSCCSDCRQPGSSVTTDHLESTTSKPPHHASASAPAADLLRVTLTSPALLVPPALAALLHRLPFQSPAVVRCCPPAQGRPGCSRTARRAGTSAPPLSPAASVLTASRRDPARNAALLALAADLPVAVLGDLLDLSISTALSWTRQASRDWIGFICARGADQPEHSPRPPTDAPAREPTSPWPNSTPPAPLTGR
jgi:hypothetical protein